MKITITLPSIYPDALSAAIDNIKATTRNEHHIIVVSPFEVHRSDVFWIRDINGCGANYAHNVAARFADGDFITVAVDDFHYVDGWDEILIADFLDREQQAKTDLLMGIRYVTNDYVGTVFGIYYANFPFMRQSCLKKIGWLGSEYVRGFGDSDLSLRFWSAGGRVEFSERALLEPVPDPGGSSFTLDHVRKQDVLFTEQDYATFVTRWGGQYGIGWDIANLRGFNHDFNIRQFPQALAACGRTVYNNNSFSFHQSISCP